MIVCWRVDLKAQEYKLKLIQNNQQTIEWSETLPVNLVSVINISCETRSISWALSENVSTERCDLTKFTHARDFEDDSRLVDNNLTLTSTKSKFKQFVHHTKSTFISQSCVRTKLLVTSYYSKTYIKIY